MTEHTSFAVLGLLPDRYKTLRKQFGIPILPDTGYLTMTRIADWDRAFEKAVAANETTNGADSIDAQVEAEFRARAARRARRGG